MRMTTNPTRIILVYGDFNIPMVDDNPVNFFLLRFPSKGIKWRSVMVAVRQFLRTNYGEKARNGRTVAPYFNVDGNPEEWDTTKFPKYEYENGKLVVR